MLALNDSASLCEIGEFSRDEPEALDVECRLSEVFMSSEESGDDEDDDEDDKPNVGGVVCEISWRASFKSLFLR